jgi:hypothetical protein
MTLRAGSIKMIINNEKANYFSIASMIQVILPNYIFLAQKSKIDTKNPRNTRHV